MKWWARLMLLGAGLYVMAYGVAQLRRGVFSYANAGYHQTTFSAGAVGVGFFMAALSLLPAGDWVYKRITTRKERRKRVGRSKRVARRSVDRG